MIEIPRAALTADEIAKEAEFFCFGTNDLTQMTFGFSRDDAGKFLDRLLREEDLRVRSVRPPGPEWRWQAGADGCQTGPSDPPGHQARHLRRARRRSVLCHVLPQGWSELCFLLSVPCADRSSGGGSCGDPREAGSAVSCKVSFTGDTANLPYPFFLCGFML